jgi:hypothetical protein
MRAKSGGVWMHARIEGGCLMKIYEFDVTLKGVCEVTDDQADALFAAGCDDGTPACCNGLAWIHFDREAASLEDAIRSAITQVRSAGFSVSKVELDAEAAVSLGT